MSTQIGMFPTIRSVMVSHHIQEPRFFQLSTKSKNQSTQMEHYKTTNSYMYMVAVHLWLFCTQFILFPVSSFPVSCLFLPCTYELATGYFKKQEMLYQRLQPNNDMYINQSQSILYMNSRWMKDLIDDKQKGSLMQCVFVVQLVVMSSVTKITANVRI